MRVMGFLFTYYGLIEKSNGRSHLDLMTPKCSQGTKVEDVKLETGGLEAVMWRCLLLEVEMMSRAERLEEFGRNPTPSVRWRWVTMMMVMMFLFRDAGSLGLVEMEWKHAPIGPPKWPPASHHIPKLCPRVPGTLVSTSAPEHPRWVSGMSNPLSPLIQFEKLGLAVFPG